MIDYGLVSVITPTWNCAKFIAETIASVQAQTYCKWELIISDDCSTDNTREIIEQLIAKDHRIVYICSETNMGAAEARNRALRIAKGQWIAFLDSDDIWNSNKLEHQLKFMVDNDFAFSYHEYQEISENGQDLGVYVSGKKIVYRLDMYTCCWPGCLTVMYNRGKIGLIQISNIKKNNDTAIWLKVIRKSPCYLLQENLARYRRRNGSTTPRTLLKRIWAHYPLFRVAENMNPIYAGFYVIANIIGNGIKKMFYVKKQCINHT